MTMLIVGQTVRPPRRKRHREETRDERMPPPKPLPDGSARRVTIAAPYRRVRSKRRDLLVK